MPLDLFSALTDQIATHTLEQYYEFCGKPKEASPEVSLDGDDEFDIDSYFGGKVNHSIGDSLEEQFSKMKSPEHAKGKATAEAEALAKAKEKLKEVKISAGTGSAETDTTINLSQNEDGAVSSNTVQVPMSAEQFKALMEEEKKEVFVAPEVQQQIKSFKDVRVYTTTEIFNETPVVYDAVIYDTVN